MALDSMDKNKDSKTHQTGKEVGQETFAEKMKKKKKKQKQDAKEFRNPYNYLKRYLILLAIPFIFLGIDVSLLFASDIKPETSDLLSTISFSIYGGFIYFFYLPISILQEFLIQINFHIPLYIILDIEKDVFSNFNFLSANWNTFNLNLHETLDSKYVYFEYLGHDAKKTIALFSEYLIYSLIKLLIVGYVLFFFTSKLVSHLAGWGSSPFNDVYEKFKKNAYGSGKTKEEISKMKANTKKYQKELLKTKGARVEYLNVFKDSFEKRNAMFCAIFGGKLFEDKPKEYKLLPAINEVFDSYIPNKYYNIINFMTDVDMTIINIEAEEFEDTYTQKEYTDEDFQIFLKHFNSDVRKFIVPTFVTTLRKYRTFDVHNIIKMLIENKDVDLAKDFSSDEINKIKRLSKDSYKMFLEEDNENQDAIGLSIQIRYPFSFTLNNIEEIEILRDKTKIIISKMRLKYLSSDENMKVYDLEADDTNEDAKKYYDDDFQIYLESILKYTDEFFNIAMKNKYTWINSDLGDKFKVIFKYMIYLNFNTNYWMEEFSGLNTSHFKALYMVENSLNNEEKDVLFEHLNEKFENGISEDALEYSTDVFIEELEFLKGKNMGVFVIIKLATKYLETIDDENQIYSFVDEFLSFYSELSNSLNKNN